MVVRANELHQEGEFDANITAKVTQANGIDVGAFTSEEEAVVSVEVMGFGSCEVMMGQEGEHRRGILVFARRSFASPILISRLDIA